MPARDTSSAACIEFGRSSAVSKPRFAISVPSARHVDTRPTDTRRHGDVRIGRGPPDIIDGRQRHDGVAEPVRRQNDQALHRVVPCVLSMKQTPPPLLSVVMPVYNERTTIDEIVRRVLAVPLRI